MWTNLQILVDLLTFTKDILMGKLHFSKVTPVFGSETGTYWLDDIRYPWTLNAVQPLNLKEQKTVYVVHNVWLLTWKTERF